MRMSKCILMLTLVSGIITSQCIDLVALANEEDNLTNSQNLVNASHGDHNLQPIFLTQEEVETEITLESESQTTSKDETNPTDPTNIQFQITTGLEWTNLDDDLGDTYTFNVDSWIPLSKQDLFSVDVNLSMSNIQGEPTFVGLGDTRIRYFHLIPVQNAGILQAVAPSLDMFIPTGDENKGLGGGSWIIAPNVIFALKFNDNITAYPLIRFVQSFSAVEAQFVPDLGIPTEGGKNKETDVTGINIELPTTFQFAEAWWFTVSPNLFQNFTGNRGTTFSSKFSVTTAIDNLSPSLEVNVPIAGDNGFDIGVKGSVTIFF